MKDSKRLALIHATVEELGWEPETPEFFKAVALLASGSVGPDVKAIIDFTGLPEAVVAEVAQAARKNGIWTEDGMIDANWKDPEEGSTAFVCDALVVEGLMERSR